MGSEILDCVRNENSHVGHKIEMPAHIEDSQNLEYKASNLANKRIGLRDFLFIVI